MDNNIQVDIQGMNLNDMLKKNDIQVRIGTTWYMLDEIGPITEPDTFPIMVSDEDGESFEFDMADIDELDPVFTLMDNCNQGNIVGEA